MNCIVPDTASYPVNSGMLTTNVRIAMPSASQRAVFARPAPVNDTSAPPTIGSQMTRLNMWVRFIAGVSEGPSRFHHIPQAAEQSDEPENHRECIGVEIAGLQP